MSLVKRFASSVLWAQAGKVAETALAFILSIVVIRRLGPELYGEYGLALGILGVGTLLTSLGFRQILGKHVPQLTTKGDVPGVRFLLRWALAWRVALSLAVLAAFLATAGLLARFFRLPDLRLYSAPLALLFIVQNAYLLLVALFNATLQMKRVVVINLVLWTADLAIVLTLFHLYGVSVVAVLYSSAIATALSLAVGLFLVRHWLRGDAKPAPARPWWRFGATIWLTELATFGLGNETDILFMGYFLSDRAQIGFYRAAVMPVQRAMGFLFGAWSGLTMPVLAESHAARGEEGVRRAWNGYIKLVSLLALPLLILLAALAEPILGLLYTDQFLQSARLLQLYVLFKVISFAIGHGLSTEMLQTLGRERLPFGMRLAGGGLNVLLNLLLIPRWGAAGALAATGVSGLLVWFIETTVVVRHYRLQYPWAFLAKLLLASLVAAVVARLLPPGGWAGLMAGCAAFGLIFAGLFYLLRPLSEQDKAILVGVAPRMARLVNLL